MCTSELRRLKEIYPEFSEEVAFFAVGAHFGISQPIETLEKYRDKNDYPWRVAAADSWILRDLGITLQSTKLAFDSEGRIVYRGEMGQGSDGEWRDLFAELAEGHEEE